jgi:MFS family permease
MQKVTTRETPITQTATTSADARHPFAIPAFRAFWFGQTAVMLAVQFYFVALTWLVLDVTGSGAELGTVLMVNAIPRMLLLLLGGALSDRVHPRVLLFSTAALNALLTGAIALMLASDALTIALLMALAAAFGAVDAFFYPTAQSMAPRLVSGERLNLANAFTQGAEQITNVLGPALAGFAISIIGLPVVFGVNTLLFAFGALLMRQVKGVPRAETERKGSLWGEIREGLRAAWNNRAIRVSMFIVAAINFAMIGPIIIGGAKMAESRFGGDAAVFGSLMSAYGVGALIGAVVAGSIRPNVSQARMLGGTSALLGLMMAGIGFAQQVEVVYILAAIMGLGGGFAGVSAVTWMQRSTEPHMQGRIASLTMFAAVALDPFSQAFAGFIVDIGIPVLFSISGGLLILTGIIAISQRIR